MKKQKPRSRRDFWLDYGGLSVPLIFDFEGDKNSKYENRTTDDSNQSQNTHFTFSFLATAAA
jgi:hypothetical protein